LPLSVVGAHPGALSALVQVGSAWLVTALSALSALTALSALSHCRKFRKSKLENKGK